jgi:predicted PurR-regulated permease PerM
MNVLDIVLVVSLACLAFCSLIFTVFFVPVLIQLTKTLKTLRELINIFKNYVHGIESNFCRASQTVKSLGSYLSSLLAATISGLTEFFSSHKHNR